MAARRRIDELLHLWVKWFTGDFSGLVFREDGRGREAFFHAGGPIVEVFLAWHLHLRPACRADTDDSAGAKALDDEVGTKANLDATAAQRRNSVRIRDLQVIPSRTAWPSSDFIPSAGQMPSAIMSSIARRSVRHHRMSQRQVVLLTGASVGLGLAIARRLLREQRTLELHVVLTSREASLPRFRAQGICEEDGVWCLACRDTNTR